MKEIIEKKYDEICRNIAYEKNKGWATKLRTLEQEEEKRLNLLKVEPGFDNEIIKTKLIDDFSEE